MKTAFLIECHYPMKHYPEWDGKLAELAKPFKGKDVASGTDFRTRDIQFIFKTAEDARKFYFKAKRLCGEFEVEGTIRFE